MSLAQWTEPKPCALSRPRFVKIRLRDERGVPTGETYTKRISRPTCASGEEAKHTACVDGKVYHLCVGCSRADLLDSLGVSEDRPVAQEWAAPPMAQDGDLILVRCTPDTRKLRRALAARGFVAKPRTRTVRRRGCLTCDVSVWVRP